MHQVKLRRLSGKKDRLSVGITIPKAILRHNGIIQDDSMTGEYHVFVEYDREENMLKVPLPNPAKTDTANTPEEALVERERENQLSPGEREVLGDQATAGAMEGD